MFVCTADLAFGCCGIENLVMFHDCDFRNGRQTMLFMLEPAMKILRRHDGGIMVSDCICSVGMFSVN